MLSTYCSAGSQTDISDPDMASASLKLFTFFWKVCCCSPSQKEHNTKSVHFQTEGVSQGCSRSSGHISRLMWASFEAALVTQRCAVAFIRGNTQTCSSSFMFNERNSRWKPHITTYLQHRDWNCSAKTWHTDHLASVIDLEALSSGVFPKIWCVTFASLPFIHWVCSALLSKFVRIIDAGGLFSGGGWLTCLLKTAEEERREQVLCGAEPRSSFLMRNCFPLHIFCSFWDVAPFFHRTFILHLPHSTPLFILLLALSHSFTVSF